LLHFAIQCRQNKACSLKSTRVTNSARSQCCVTWQTDAVALLKCSLGLPSQPLSPRQLQQ
jgi:hypothetical protein